ncbi:MAG: dynamin family protein [Streptococcaceae bacterium]|jgi:GTPase Era involved in 16S rRNA processing|nr:dynamin family protein [Streptococcaceae bacterium]
MNKVPTENILIQLSDIEIRGFTTSLDFSKHPLIKARIKRRLLYFAALESLTKLCASDSQYANYRLQQYKNVLIGNKESIPLMVGNCDKTINKIVNDLLKPWKRKYGPMLLVDIAFILVNDDSINKAFDIIRDFLTKRQKKRLDEVLELLFNNARIPPKLSNSENLIQQFRINRKFTSQETMRIMVTANMSAGKSTLINALIGKTLTRTSQEACTANLSYLYNKPFEDNKIHLKESSLNLNATGDDLFNKTQESVSTIASYFRTVEHHERKICFIDTPGVNSALNTNHGKVTRKAISDKDYDKLVYVLNANELGTDDEIKYLKYIYQNVPAEKLIFVLNKLDTFRSVDDSISTSIEDVKDDLEKIGFKDPKICPISAYFSLLLKLKKYGEELNEDEQDEFDFYINKFNKPEFDLSIYYQEEFVEVDSIYDNFIKMSLKCGLYGLENILYGGIANEKSIN